MRTTPTLLLLVALGLGMPAVAQWKWRDQNNKLVFSDQPPPSDVPEARILQRPGPKPPAAPAAAVAPTAPSGNEASPNAPGQDKELQERRQQAEAQEAAKRAAQEEANAKARTDNCARARQAKTSYDSGVRIARLDAKGEREFIDDATRAAESRRLQGIIASDCR